MSPADLAQRIAALDWSACSLQHQLAVTAAVETLTRLDAPMPFPPDPLVIFAPEISNVLTLPVKPRTCWTTLCQLDGRRWATSSHFGPGGAWNWILETVAHEWEVREEQVGCIESDADGPYEGDDLVTIDGLPVYRIGHLVK